MKRLTLKFGGTSVGSIENIRKVANIIKENSKVSTNPLSDVDDGPQTWYYNQAHYKSSTASIAKKLGMEILNYLSGDQEILREPSRYKTNTRQPSYYPSGVPGKTTTVNPKIYPNQNIHMDIVVIHYLLVRISQIKDILKKNLNAEK